MSKITTLQDLKSIYIPAFFKHIPSFPYPMNCTYYPIIIHYLQIENKTISPRSLPFPFSFALFFCPFLLPFSFALFFCPFLLPLPFPRKTKQQGLQVNYGAAIWTCKLCCFVSLKVWMKRCIIRHNHYYIKIYKDKTERGI